MRHFRSIEDVSPDELKELVELAIELKRERAAGVDRIQKVRPILGLLFEKPSMRTRVSFEAGIAQLGGSSIFLSRDEVGLGKRESIADFARVISEYLDLLAVRTFSHQTVIELARYANCSVINALSDTAHPCQALGDLCTIKEQFGRIEGIRVAFVGDGNNVARSLALACKYAGLDFVLSAPAEYRFPADFLQYVEGAPGAGSVSYEQAPREAVAGADVIYTDVWASMGQESETAKRKLDFADYQVNTDLFSRAKPTTKFLHCLPAHRGEEVSADVIDGPSSVVIAQAGNRLHAQKALMLWLLQQARGDR